MNNLHEQENDIFVILGQNVRRIREKQNLSLKELSEKTGIRKEYLKKIEDGKAYGLKTSHIFILANSLNVLPHTLVRK